MPSPKRTAITLSGEMRHALRCLDADLSKRLPVEAMRDHDKLHEYEVLATESVMRQLYAFAKGLKTDHDFSMRDGDPIERYAHQLLFNVGFHFVRRLNFSAREPEADTPYCQLVSEHPMEDEGGEKLARRRRYKGRTERLQAESLQRRQGEAMIERAYRA